MFVVYGKMGSEYGFFKCNLFSLLSGRCIFRYTALCRDKPSYAGFFVYLKTFSFSHLRKELKRVKLSLIVKGQCSSHRKRQLGSVCKLAVKTYSGQRIRFLFKLCQAVHRINIRSFSFKIAVFSCTKLCKLFHRIQIGMKIHCCCFQSSALKYFIVYQAMLSSNLGRGFSCSAGAYFSCLHQHIVYPSFLQEMST